MRLLNPHTLALSLLSWSCAACSPSELPTPGGSAPAGSASGGRSAGGDSSSEGSTSGSPSSGGNRNDGQPSSGGSASGGSASGGSASGGTRAVYPPGPPGCGLPQAAFCETFDAPASTATRAGELEPKRWSAARMCNIGSASSDGAAVAIGPARMPACRAGLPEEVSPPQDALVCDGNRQIQSNHLLMLVAAQNYGQNSYRIRQPFDFADRTGKVVFDAEGYNVGLLGWISLDLTEDPAPAPSFTLQQNFENGSIPRNGVEIQFSHSCGGGKVGIGALLVYRDFVQTALLENEGSCVEAAAGKLNHFELEIASKRLAIYATPASEDGLEFAARVLLAGVDVELPFSRGYVHVTAHNHATLKYSDDTVDAWQARWDNVGFDGPAITSGWREYEVLDSGFRTNGKVNVGWRLADEAEGPAQKIEIPAVDPAGALRARIALQNWSLHYAGESPEPNFALNYRLNGHAWNKRTLTASELQLMVDLPNAGTRSLMLEVSPADLVAGTNTLELTTSNAPTSYPPVALNIDLILQTQ